VFIDAFRCGLLKKLERRNIRMQRETETKKEVIPYQLLPV
jgi:hypothetical protein